VQKTVLDQGGIIIKEIQIDQNIHVARVWSSTPPRIPFPPPFFFSVSTLFPFSPSDRHRVEQERKLSSTDEEADVHVPATAHRAELPGDKAKVLSEDGEVYRQL
jgi:hypothetical protein